MRVDKLTIAALSATLELYRDPSRAVHEIPTLAMIAATSDQVRKRCELLAGELRPRGIACSVTPSDASVGAGAFPTYGIPSFSVTLEGDARTLEQKLRRNALPVIGRISDDRLHLDLRSVPERDDAELLATLVAGLT
jgi:L-seryl-tRNA(Ser) seleniumtransferase